MWLMAAAVTARASIKTGSRVNPSPRLPRLGCCLLGVHFWNMDHAQISCDTYYSSHGYFLFVGCTSRTSGLINNAAKLVTSSPSSSLRSMLRRLHSKQLPKLANSWRGENSEGERKRSQKFSAACLEIWDLITHCLSSSVIISDFSLAYSLRFSS